MIVNTDYTIQFMNKAATEHFGSLKDGSCWKLLGKRVACPDCPVQFYLHGNKDAHNYAIDLRNRHYDVVIAPLLDPDGSTALIEVYRDITQRRQIEEREKRMQQELNLSRRLASIGELAAGIAHEINNPLTGILGFSERLLRKSTDDKVSAELQIIYDEASKAAKVVNNLRTFARHHQSEKQLVSVNDIIQRSLELRVYELETGNIEVIKKLASDLPAIMGDFHQLQQVFINIILNAEQAIIGSKRRGKLFIRTQKIKDSIRISFTDNGPEIPNDMLDRVFDPFFTTKGNQGGTGLGLSICHGIIAEHNGRIYAKSKPRKGASFIIELPLQTEYIDNKKIVEKVPIQTSK